MDAQTRGNYDSGEDFVLEYGELRFTFNERDFAERCEQAARKLGFVGGTLDEGELEDLVNLAVNGEVQEPASGLGEHVNDCWPELVGPADRSLVHWLRRLVFRSAWLDQRVKEGELDVVLRLGAPDLLLRPARPRRRARRAGARAELGARRRTRPAARPPSGAARAARAPAASAFCARLGDRRRLARADERLDAQREARGGRAPGGARRGGRGVEPDQRGLPPTGSRAAAMIVSVPPSGTRAPRRATRRAAAGVSWSSESTTTAAWPPRAASAWPVDDAVDRLGLRVRALAELGDGAGSISAAFHSRELLGARPGEHDAELDALLGGELDREQAQRRRAAGAGPAGDGDARAAADRRQVGDLP